MLFAVAAVVALAPAPAVAQVGETASFLPKVWQPGGESRPGAKARARRGSITSSTSFDDFDVPRRASQSRAARIVERRRGAQRVRVAAIDRAPTATYVDASGPRRARVTVKKRAKAKSVVQRSMMGGVRSLAAPQPSLTGGGIAWRANSGCLAGNLRSIVSVVASRFGGVTVNSTCRSATHNRRVGGARKSWHLTGNAVDFRVRTASVAGLSAYLRTVAGGFKHYGGGRYHIDNGPKRTF